LLRRWELRPTLRPLPQFSALSSNSLEIIGRHAFSKTIEAGESININEDSWYLLAKGELTSGEPVGTEYGFKPLSESNPCTVTAKTDTTFVCLTADLAEQVRLEVPQLNYALRKYRVNQSNPAVDWVLGVLPIY
jgi:hypothetical protein